MNSIMKRLQFGVKKAKKKVEVDDSELRLSKVTPEMVEEYEDIKARMKERQIEEEETPKKAPKRKYVESDDDSSENGDLKRKMNELTSKIHAANRIFTWGTDIPHPLLKFQHIELPEEIKKALEESKITEPSPIQMQAIPLMEAKRNVLASAPTGSGKTLAFAIPIINALTKLKKLKKYKKGGKVLAIVLEPTRELATQTFNELEKYCGGKLAVTNFNDDKEALKTDILVTTPNRLVFHLKDADLTSLRWLVVDESDRLFEVVEGQEKCFRNQLAAIYKACDGKFTKYAFFSATFSFDVEKWCKENIENVGMVCIGERNASNSSVKQELQYCGSEDGKKVALRSLLKTQFPPPALVFVQSKERANQLVKLISGIDDKLKVDSISGEKSDKQRDATMESFRKGELWVLVCTELLGRGLDFSGVNLVVNYDLPQSIISYIHRVGRTGRAGKTGRAITYFTEDDVKIIRPIATVIKQSGFEVPEYLLTLKKVSKQEKKKLLKSAPKRQKIAFVEKKKPKKDWKKIKAKKRAEAAAKKSEEKKSEEK